MLDRLIALGIIVLIGRGVYKFLKSFGGYDEGDEVSAVELEDDDACPTCLNCGTENPPLCKQCSRCLVCNDEIQGFCRHCFDYNFYD